MARPVAKLKPVAPHSGPPEQPPAVVVDQRVAVPAVRITLVAGEGKGATPVARVDFGLLAGEVRLLNFSGFVDARPAGAGRVGEAAGWRGVIRYPNRTYTISVLFEYSLAVTDAEPIKTAVATLLQQFAGAGRHLAGPHP